MQRLWITKRKHKLVRSSPKVPKVAKANYKPSEGEIAIAFIDYVKKAHPELIDFVVKIDNENKCSLSEGLKKKRQGKKKGASDYFVSHPVIKQRKGADGEINQYVVCGLWLELKKHDGKLTKEQKDFGQKVVSKGYEFAAAYSIEEAIKDLEDYLKI
jgi:hypothetical protein